MNELTKLYTIGRQRFGAGTTLHDIIKYSQREYIDLGCGNEQVNKMDRQEWINLKMTVKNYYKMQLAKFAEKHPGGTLGELFFEGRPTLFYECWSDLPGACEKMETCQEIIRVLKRSKTLAYEWSHNYNVLNVFVKQEA